MTCVLLSAKNLINFSISFLSWPLNLVFDIFFDTVHRVLGYESTLRPIFSTQIWVLTTFHKFSFVFVLFYSATGVSLLFFLWTILTHQVWNYQSQFLHFLSLFRQYFTCIPVCLHAAPTAAGFKHKFSGLNTRFTGKFRENHDMKKRYILVETQHWWMNQWTIHALVENERMMSAWQIVHNRVCFVTKGVYKYILL